jgi:Tol biopolymer transport system component
VTGSIAFDAAKLSNSHVWVVDDNGVGPAQDLTAGATTFDTKPAWSPDGRQIAFVRYPFGTGSAIWVMNVDGTNPHQLTGSAGALDDPTWSAPMLESLPPLFPAPGSNALSTIVGVVRNTNAWLVALPRVLQRVEVTKIAYMRINASYYAVSLINADGTNQHDILGYFPGSTENGREPCWSPDGARIAFTHIHRIPGAITDRVAVMDADGSGVTDLPPGTPLPGPPFDRNPSWSPDGSTIAFERGLWGHRDVWTMDTSGAGLVGLTSGPGDDHSPAWSPDSTKIAFVSDRSGGSDIWTMDASGSGLTNVTKGLYGACGNPAWSSHSFGSVD